MSMSNAAASIKILSDLHGQFKDLFADEALQFVLRMHRKFSSEWEIVRKRRAKWKATIDKGALVDFLQDDRSTAIRNGTWKVDYNAIPEQMRDRAVELVTPAVPKMVVNAATSHHSGFPRPSAVLFDLEDAGHYSAFYLANAISALSDHTKGKLTYLHPQTKKKYHYDISKDGRNVVIVRPNGFGAAPIQEITIDGKPAERGLFELSLHAFYNGALLSQNREGPFYYIPKMESYLEARLWYRVFQEVETQLKLPRGCIKCTPLIETFPATFQMNEIIFELAGGTDSDVAALKQNKSVIFSKETHIVGINYGRHDAGFSTIKTYANHADKSWPRKSDTSMLTHCTKSAWELLVKTAHSRGVFAIGGMAVAVPNSPKLNQIAYDDTIKDKKREVNDGADGTWVAHPGLLEVAMKTMKTYMKSANQLNVMRDDVSVSAADLNLTPTGKITKDSFIENITKPLAYCEAWLRGQGCIPFTPTFKKITKPASMEDVATTERARSELYSWVKHNLKLEDGTIITKDFFRKELTRILSEIDKQFQNGTYHSQGRMGEKSWDKTHFKLAAKVLEEVVCSDTFIPFITTPLYREFLTLQALSIRNRL